MRIKEGLRSAPVRLTLAAAAASACVLAASPPSTAITQTSTSQSLAIAPAPNAQATRPEAITVSGQAGLPSRLAIYAQLNGSCAAQSGDEAAKGATLVDQRTVSGAFSYVVTFTPAAPGTYAICTYLDGAAGGTTEHQNQSSALSVATAPPPTPSPATPPGKPGTSVGPGGPCLVPSLKRHTLGGAKHFLRVANCRLGRVYQPSARALRAAKRRAGGRAPKLVVVSQTPLPGTRASAGYTVAVRLAVAGPTHHRATRGKA